MLFFTGSDWCGWCIRLQKEVFFKPEFTKWAAENVVLVELDFPRKSTIKGAKGSKCSTTTTISGKRVSYHMVCESR